MTGRKCVFIYSENFLKADASKNCMIHNTFYAVSMTGEKYIEKMSMKFLMKKTLVFVQEASQYGVTDIFILK